MLACVAALLPLALGIATAARAQTFDEALRLHTDGRAREALAAYRAVARSPAPAEDRAAALNNACVLAGELGEHAAALADCEAALRLRRTLGDEAAVAETANNLGLALETLGRAREAEARYREALALNRRLGDSESVVVNLGNLGALALGAGRYSEAMRLYREAAAIAAAARDAPWAGEQLRIARINQGVVLEKVGEYRDAVALYKQLLAADDGGGADPRQRAGLLVNAGVIYRNLDDAVSALAAFDEAAAIYRELGDVSGLSNAELNRALALHLNLGRPRAAEAAYREALALAEKSGDRTEQVQDLFYLGRLLLDESRRTGDVAKLAEAEALFRRCLEVAQSSGSAEGRWSALEGLGRIAAARGDLDGALRQLAAALAEIERVRAGLVQAPWRAGYFGDKRAVYAATVGVLARLAARQPNAGFAERAFAVVQRAKARDLLDLLGSGRQPAPPRTAAEVGARLGGDVAIEYFAGEGRLHRWVLRDGRVELADLGESAPVLEAVTRVHRALAGGREPDARDLARLSGTLLPSPLLLPERGGELRIAPDGLLHYLPFELLPAGGDGVPLVELATVSYLPSSSTLLRTASGGRSALQLAAFAAPDVPAAAREVRAIAELLGGSRLLYTGDAASEASFRAAVARRPAVLHLATHAVVEEPPGRGASIRLRAAGADDGRLTPPEIAATGAATRLSVLAACRTALVSPRDEGRTLASLTGSFLAAGSPAVVATLWDVGDEATAAFMPQLYAQLARGLTPAEALRRAKQRLREDPRWNRPSLWSAYVLVGDGGPVVDPPAWRRGLGSAMGGRALLAAAALALLAIAAFIWALPPRRR